MQRPTEPRPGQRYQRIKRTYHRGDRVRVLTAYESRAIYAGMVGIVAHSPNQYNTTTISVKFPGIKNPQYVLVKDVEKVQVPDEQPQREA